MLGSSTSRPQGGGGDGDREDIAPPLEEEEEPIRGGRRVRTGGDPIWSYFFLLYLYTKKKTGGCIHIREWVHLFRQRSRRERED